MGVNEDPNIAPFLHNDKSTIAAVESTDRLEDPESALAIPTRGPPLNIRWTIISNNISYQFQAITSST